MNRRGAFRQTLYERIHGHPPEPEPSAIRHCWVLGEHGRLPGLLLEWRRTVAGWQGRVVHPELDAGAWVVVEEWLGADRLEQA
jgi:hypothetical protein